MKTNFNQDHSRVSQARVHALKTWLTTHDLSTDPLAPALEVEERWSAARESLQGHAQAAADAAVVRLLDGADPVACAKDFAAARGRDIYGVELDTRMTSGFLHRLFQALEASWPRVIQEAEPLLTKWTLAMEVAGLRLKDWDAERALRTGAGDAWGAGTTAVGELIRLPGLWPRGLASDDGWLVLVDTPEVKPLVTNRDLDLTDQITRAQHEARRSLQESWNESPRVALLGVAQGVYPGYTLKVATSQRELKARDARAAASRRAPTEDEALEHGRRQRGVKV